MLSPDNRLRRRSDFAAAVRRGRRAGRPLLTVHLLSDWVWPSTPLVWTAMISCGVWAAIGHALFIAAFRFAPASTLMPFTYLGLLTHSAAGYLVFTQVPDAQTLAGAVIVVASGLYLLHRERVREVIKPLA